MPSNTAAENLPRLTFLLPNYNDGAELGQQIEAVAAAGVPVHQFLICDDASTDDSLEQIARWQRRYPWVQLERNDRNLGVNATIDRLWPLATGDWLVMLSANDRIQPDYLRRAYEVMSQCSHVHAIVGEMLIEYENPHEVRRARVQGWESDRFLAPAEFLTDYLQRPDLILHSFGPTLILRREAMATVGGCRRELESWSDVFFVRELGVRYGIYYLAQPAVLFRAKIDSYSGRQSRDPLQMRQIYQTAIACMREERNRPYFPESYVRWWSREIVRELQRQSTINAQRASTAASKPLE